MAELALPYVPIDPNIETHPKTRKFLRAIGKADDPMAHTHLVVFLLTVGRHHPTGRLGPMEDDDIADMGRWRGDAALFADALRTSGWLQIGEGGYWVVGWEDYGGRVLKKREQWREQQQSRRNNTTNDKSTTYKERQPDVSRTPPDINKTPPESVTQKVKSEGEGEGEGEGEVESKSKPLSVSRERDPDNDPAPATQQAPDIAEVFEHYRLYHERAHPKPTSKSKEWKAIKARLLEGYSVEDLKRAIDGCHMSPWHAGENQRQTTYQQLELIMRDGSHVNQFLEIAERHANGPPPVLSEKEQRGRRAGQQWLERKRQQEQQAARPVEGVVIDATG